MEQRSPIFSIPLFLAKDPNETNGEDADQNDRQQRGIRNELEPAVSGNEAPRKDTKEQENSSKPLQKIVWGAYLVWSFSLWFLGVALSLGLLLNLCGYGYIVTKEDGLRIDTITQLRKERQMQQESIRYRNEYEHRMNLLRQTTDNH